MYIYIYMHKWYIVLCKCSCRFSNNQILSHHGDVHTIAMALPRCISTRAADHTSRWQDNASSVVVGEKQSQIDMVIPSGSLT